MKYLFLFISFFTLLIVFAPEDPAWVECSNKNDLYRYINEGWLVKKVQKKGDISYTVSGQKQIYRKNNPQIFLYKGQRIKVLNFGSRCWFEEGAEYNYSIYNPINNGITGTKPAREEIN